jgi:hypothetical protein
MHAIRSARAAAFGWRAGGGALVSTAVLAMGLGALLIGASHAAALVLFLFGGVVLGLAMMATRRGRGAAREAAARLEALWETFALRAVRAHGEGATAASVARTLGVGEEEAERLLARVSLDDELRVRVDPSLTLGAGKRAAPDATPDATRDSQPRASASGSGDDDDAPQAGKRRAT